jgi:alpha-1,2-mannosyltransferase
VNGTPVGLPAEDPQDSSDGGPAGAARRSLRLTPVAAVITAATLLALALRVYQLVRPGHLLGVGDYDEGADFGSAVLLTRGGLPYRDFIMLHPPGIVLLMTPAALLSPLAGTAWAIATARIFTIAASAGAVVLGGLIVRHRGLFAVVAACGLIAIYPGNVQAAHVVLLEPWLVLFCLAAVALAFDGDSPASSGRLTWSGVAIGFAAAVKLWAVIPAVVLLVILAARRRHAVRYLAGLAAGFLIPVLPFAAMAPGRFYDDVVKAQLVRTSARTPLSYRLDQLAGLGWLPAGLAAHIVAVVVAVIAVAGVATLTGAWLAAHRKPPALEWFAVAAAGLVAAAFLVPDNFYYHYAAFFGPFLALAIALPAARLAGNADHEEKGPGNSPEPQPPLGRPGRLRRAGAGAVAVAVVILPIAVPRAESVPGSTDSAAIAVITRVIPPGACVVSDQASVLISADRFVSSVPGCLQVVDGFGASYALAGRPTSAAGANLAVAELWKRAFRAAQYVLLTHYNQRRIAWTPELRAYLRSNFTYVSGPWPELKLYARRTHQADMRPPGGWRGWVCPACRAGTPDEQGDAMSPHWIFTGEDASARSGADYLCHERRKIYGGWSRHWEAAWV